MSISESSLSPNKRKKSGIQSKSSFISESNHGIDLSHLRDEFKNVMNYSKPKMRKKLSQAAVSQIAK